MLNAVSYFHGTRWYPRVDCTMVILLSVLVYLVKNARPEPFSEKQIKMEINQTV